MLFQKLLNFGSLLSNWHFNANIWPYLAFHNLFKTYCLLTICTPKMAVWIAVYFKPKLTLPWPILAKFDLVQPTFLLFIYNSYSALKMVWKDGLILVFRLLKRFLSQERSSLQLGKVSAILGKVKDPFLPFLSQNGQKERWERWKERI